MVAPIVAADLLDTSPSFHIEHIGYEYDFALEVAATGNGFVVVWDEYDSAEGPTAVRGARVGVDLDDGACCGFTVASGTEYFEGARSPSVAEFSDGGFIVTWTSYFDETEIRAQRFDEAATTAGTEFVIGGSSVGLRDDAVVATAGDGGFLVAWRASTMAGSEIRAVRYDEDAIAQGGLITASAGGSTDVRRTMAASGGSDGSFVVVWNAGYTYETGAAGGYYPYTRVEGRGRVIAPDGSTPDPIFSAGGQYGLKVRHLVDDGFVVAWSDSYRSYDVYPAPLNTYARIRRTDGSVDSLQVSERRGDDADGADVALAPSGDGGFVVAWSHTTADSYVVTDSADVLVQQVAGTGVHEGKAVPLDVRDQSRPPIAPALAVADDRALVAWIDDNEIRGQILTIVGEVVCADANRDGSISSTDALIALTTAVGIGYCSRLLCDADGDGATDATDALIILKAAVGAIDAPTC